MAPNVQKIYEIAFWQLNKVQKVPGKYWELCYVQKILEIELYVKKVPRIAFGTKV